MIYRKSENVQNLFVSLFSVQSHLMREMFSQRSATLNRNHLVDNRIRKTGRRGQMAIIRESRPSSGWGRE